MSETDAVVFVVDDDPSMRRSLERLLRSVGLGAAFRLGPGIHADASGPTRRAAWCSTCGCPA